MMLRLLIIGSLLSISAPFTYAQNIVGRFNCQRREATMDRQGRLASGVPRDFFVVLYSNQTAYAEGIIGGTIPYKAQYTWRTYIDEYTQKKNILFQGNASSRIMPTMPDGFGGEITETGNIEFSNTDQTGGTYLRCTSV